MKLNWIITPAIAVALVGCAKNQQHTTAQHERDVAAAEAPEPGEIKVKLEETPPAVRAAIEKELVGADLEDIAKKQKGGKTVYETDIVKGGAKWEVNVAEDGTIINRVKEGSADEEKAADQQEKAKAKSADADASFRQKFNVENEDFRPTGKNPYLAIQPGRVQKMKNKDGDTLTITILPDTLTVDGVKVGVLEERETKNHNLEEVSRNFFATDAETGDVYYFGEDVDNYKDGKIISHDSAWRAGQNGAKYGLMIAAKPKVGDKYYQEIAPKVAMDRVEVVSTDETVKTPAGTFQHCVHLKETTPMEPDISHKYFAPGVGMIKDDDFELAEKP